MKTITTNGKRICAVQTEPNAILFEIDETDPTLLGFVYEHSDSPEFIPLPPGNWRILGLSNELTEEQQSEIVEIAKEVSYWDDPNDVFYVDYTVTDDTRYAHTVQESYASFLSANKIEPNELLLIEEI